MGFLDAFSKLPKGDQKKVMNKAKKLEISPEDNGRSQRQLHGFPPTPPPPGFNLYRAYVTTTYRLIYAFNNSDLYLLAVGKKKDIGDDYTNIVQDVDKIPPKSLALVNTFLDEVNDFPEPENFEPEEGLEEKTEVPLEASPLFTEIVLNHFEVPADLKQHLLNITDKDDPKIYELSEDNPTWEELIQTLLLYLESSPDPDSTFKFPDVHDPWETIEKIANGELSPEDLSLKLSSEQEDLVNFSFEQNGAVLIKGGAGTGKSLVAHHRVGSYLKYLNGQLDYVNKRPKILYTTYTNALLNDSQKNLKNILGEDDFSKSAITQTAHATIKNTCIECMKLLKSRGLIETIRGKILEKNNKDPICINPKGLGYFSKLISSLEQQYDDPSKVKDARHLFERIGEDYLHQEIEYLIYGNRLDTLEKYLIFDRTGRKLGLNRRQRTFIWDLKVELEKITKKTKRFTFKQLAPMTLDFLETIERTSPELLNEITTYDAVVVDEGQDLTAMELKVLSKLVPSLNRLFVVADGTQAIHQAGSVNLQKNTEVDFQGRTRELKTNYRSTKQIASAASSYLHAFGLENETETTDFYNYGPKPRLWRIPGPEETHLKTEVEAIADELNLIINKQGNQLSNVAIFSESTSQCGLIQKHLKERDIPSRVCNSPDYEKSKKNQVTIMPLQSIKGLEFPIVYIAGLSEKLPRNEGIQSDAVVEENIERSVKILFVGMTRAMHVLTICVQKNPENDLFKSQNFQSDSWEISEK